MFLVSNIRSNFIVFNLERDHRKETFSTNKSKSNRTIIIFCKRFTKEPGEVGVGFYSCLKEKEEQAVFRT